MQCYFFFFFNDTATTEIYTLSLHDALPIFAPIKLRILQQSGLFSPIRMRLPELPAHMRQLDPGIDQNSMSVADRKSTRLNSSHANISYAVFCLKKKKIYDNPNALRDYFRDI